MPSPTPSAKTATPASADARPFKRSVKNYLLDRELQLRYTLVMVAISGALTTGLGWMVYHFIREASEVVSLRALDPTDTEAVHMQQQFAHNDRLLLAGLVGFGLLMCILLAGYGIVLTHKVAGPLFKISTYMNRIRDGKLGRITPLRAGDQLTDFFDTFARMHESLSQRTREEIATLELAVTEVEQAGLREAAERLRALKRQKEESIA